MKRRVAYFGGSFDPPHCGHVAIARAAIAAFELDTVLLAPTGVQPLKPGGATAPYEDRFQMVGKACAKDPQLEASRLDAPKADGSANFTVESLQHLRSSLASEDELFVLAGVDAFLDLRRWREPDKLLSLAEWIVVTRPRSPPPNEAIAALQLTGDQSRRVHLLSGVEQPESSTEIRKRLAAGASCRSMLPPEVLEYIVAHHLYGVESASDPSEAQVLYD